jgi:hypothetical protein
MIEMDALAGKIFALLKGNGLKIKIFDVDGNEVTDPSMGRRFFINEPNIMVTINDEDNSIEFSKGGGSDSELIAALQKNIRKLANEFLMNSHIKVFGKSIQPRDYSYQAKMQKEPAMMENTVKPHNHQLLGEVFHIVKRFGSATAHYIADNMHSTIAISDVQPVLNRLVQTGKLAAQPNDHGEMEYSVAVDEAVMETSTEKLTKYKTAASNDATAADKAGDTKRADKRFSGIVKATKKQFANDEKESVKESFSKMFGSLKTSQQTLENVRILVRHKTPVSEEVRGSRSRHISAIFLECNGERMRFQHNYLPGARAMAQHMAHGGIMTDKVGAYISESTDQLLKLQSFNRYVTTNKLVNEDSSGIVDTVKENIQTLRTELKKLTGAKTYETVKARLETFEREALAEDDTSSLKDMFTIRRFDEKFEEVLPIVKQLVQEKDTYHKRIEEAASADVMLRRESSNTTPMFEFASENARLGFKINEFALRINENDELASFINKIGTKICKEGTVNQFERAILTQVFENAKIAAAVASAAGVIKESTDLETFYNRFDYNFM